MNPQLKEILTRLAHHHSIEEILTALAHVADEQALQIRAAAVDSDAHLASRAWSHTARRIRQCADMVRPFFT